MLAVVNSCALVGLEGIPVRVEADFNPRGMFAFTVVGLPSKSIQESRDRVRAAIKNTRNLAFPLKRYTVNLAPADLHKDGPLYDLPIAVGALAATDQIPAGALEDALFLGELSLDGSVRHVRGVLAMAFTAREMGLSTVYVPEEDAPEAAQVPDIDVIPVNNLGQLVEHLYELALIPPFDREKLDVESIRAEYVFDYADIKGQEHAKRALEVAAAGGHHVLMSGPPGSGKTMMSQALPGILPPLTTREALEITRIYSVADQLKGSALMQARPFRNPHHTTSNAGLVGGGHIPHPGEISLAHHGVLFLDELPEFSMRVLEVLRQPIEDKEVTISRSQQSVTFPARFTLIAAMNPCPCGYYGDPIRECTCSRSTIERYQKRISGPLLDRFDIHIEVPRVDYAKLTDDRRGEPSESIRARVVAARERQTARFADYARIYANADMTPREIREFCKLDAAGDALIQQTLRKMQITARGYHRILKLSRTIADLAGSDSIELPHLAEAVQYRPRLIR